ncbi:hypothetical protein [Aeromicrobium sp. UC242_57]|uniref:hypothetical protein n=1 Tax=Aeromicrobium sp. UC242_57 TaxID=3374624 RepID=UPI0037B538BD
MTDWFEYLSERVQRKLIERPLEDRRLVVADLRAMEHLAGALQQVGAYEDEESDATGLSARHQIENHLDELFSALGHEGSQELLTVVESGLPMARRVVASLDLTMVDFKMLEDDLSALEESRNRASSRLSAIRADEAATSAEAAASRARSSQGAIGDLDLASYFSTYSKSELGSSDLFRYMTFVLSFAAVVIAVAGARWADGSKLSDSLVTHVLVVVSIGGFAAYTGRLAGQHRMKGDWAAAVAVQLRSLENFVAPVDEVTRAQIYLHFSARVLGPPPTIKGESESPGLVDLAATDLLRRRAADPAN